MLIESRSFSRKESRVVPNTLVLSAKAAGTPNRKKISHTKKLKLIIQIRFHLSGDFRQELNAF